MGKQKQKDRGYLTATEWRTEGGGFKDKSHLPFKRLPFHCCAITFTPFEDPACTADGTVYDITNIVPYVQKFKKHPVSGEPLQLKDIVQLHFHKNADNEYHDPILHKVFTESTHIVAIRTSGNVYAWEAVEELNIKPRFMQDLLTDQAFTRKDIIHIQDPMNLEGRNLSKFDHVKNDRQLVSAEDQAAHQADPVNSLKHVSEDTKRVMAKLNSADSATAFEEGGGGARAVAHRILAEAKAVASQKPHAEGPDPRLQPPEPASKDAVFKPGASTWNTDDPKQQHHAPGHGKKKKKKWQQGEPEEEASALVPAGPKKEVPKPYMSDARFVTSEFRTTGAASRSFTSTAVNVVTRNERQKVRVERNPANKGYMRLHTNLGDLNLELHCDLAPRTCENFFVLSEGGYYTNTIFHRSIKNFMIQGGDPTGTGTGGESIYGPTFKDELDSRLTHSARGVMSMANSGPATNGSQFFILYKSARHLDYKHSVFGKVVGGFDVLTAMERVSVDGDDRPEQEIKITGASVFVNPYKDMEEEERKKAEAERIKAEKEAGPPDIAEEGVGNWFSNPAGASNTTSTANGSGVGKYLSNLPKKSNAQLATESAPDIPAAPAVKKQKVKLTGYGNFDAW
ncbi:hypothetical protein WJX77_001957 [Trebouxia sp. C0004]